MAPLPSVLARYGLAVVGLRWVPVGGGFSGASVWRGEDVSPVFALKAHPPDVPLKHVRQVHTWVIQVAHLPFVPAIIPAADGSTAIAAAGRVWELTRWMPGEPELRREPSPDRLAAAVAALAVLHRAWRPGTPELAPCPGVQRRLALLRSWGRAAAPPADDLVRRAQAAVTRLAPAAIRALAPWETRPVPVQPCLCDVHPDHVLFRGRAVTGVIDFAAMKPDHVAVDLARLLGPLTDERQLAAAVSEYAAQSGEPMDPSFVRRLNLSGAVCAAAVWCRRLAAAPPTPPTRSRLEALLGCLARVDLGAFSPPC
jgi:aminoglycoside phosphotransferase (APT) family kinase protein